LGSPYKRVGDRWAGAEKWASARKRARTPGRRKLGSRRDRARVQKKVARKKKRCKKSAYENDCTINEQVRVLVPIAFVSPEDVSAVFETLEDHVHKSLEIDMSYFEENYIGKKLKRRRKEPLFTSTGGMFMTQLSRTNNNAEACFGGFKLSLAVHIQHCDVS